MNSGAKVILDCPNFVCAEYKTIQLDVLDSNNYNLFTFEFPSGSAPDLRMIVQ